MDRLRTAARQCHPDRGDGSLRDGVWNIYWIDRLTRERKQVTHRTAFGEFVRNLAWRPASDQIIYEHWLVKGESVRRRSAGIALRSKSAVARM
jgi:hypothetical protein